MAHSRSWPFDDDDRPSGSVQPLSQADLQAILARLNNDDPDELLGGTGADQPVVAVRLRATVGQPGGSAQARWRRARAAEWAAWIRTLPWRVAATLGIGAGGGVLGGTVASAATGSKQRDCRHGNRRRPRAAPVLRSAFAGFRFPPDVIVVAVRWYLRFGLSYRDVEELLAERGVEVDHVTVYRWVQRFTPLLAEAARPCRHGVGDRWQVDETYVKVAGQWRYVYRAIDQFGQVIDVFVSPRRDVRAARRFFEQAIGTTKIRPIEVVTDQAPTYPVVLEELLPRPGIAPIGTPTTGSRLTMGA